MRGVVDKACRFVAFFGLSPFKTKFRAHRVGGICFFTTYFFAWICYVFDYDYFISRKVAVIPALVGLFQALSASMTFWFLPKEKDSGFFSDKGILSKLFVRENIFYQLITTFGPFYYLYKREMEDNLFGRAVVVLFVFLPYAVLRPCFPTTRFDVAQGISEGATKSEKYRSQENKYFYERTTSLIRYFYIWGKHVMGVGFQYLFFLNKISDDDMKKWGWPLFLLNCGTVSISIFLHTLRFKHLMRPRIAHGIYVAMAYMSFISVPFLCMKMLNEWQIGLLTLGGIYVNTRRRKVLMNCWWLLAMIVVCTKRFPHVAADYRPEYLEIGLNLAWLLGMAATIGKHTIIKAKTF